MTPLEEAQKRADREHELRCSLEKRFDHRISDERQKQVIARVDVLTGRTPGYPLTHEDMEAITELISLAHSLDADRKLLREQVDCWEEMSDAYSDTQDFQNPNEGD